MLVVGSLLPMIPNLYSVHSLDILLWGMLQKIPNFIPKSHRTCWSVIIPSSSRICCPRTPANRIPRQRGGSSGPQGPFTLGGCMMNP